MIPVTNFSSLFAGNPGTTHATFGTPLEWNMPNPRRKPAKRAASASARSARTAKANTSSSPAPRTRQTDASSCGAGMANPKTNRYCSTNRIPLSRKACGARSPRRPNRSVTAAKPNCCRTTARPQWYGSGTKDAEQGLITGLQKSLGQLVKPRDPALRARPKPPHLVERREPEQRRLHAEMEAGPDAARALHAPAPERRKRRLDDGRQQPQQARIHLQTGGRRHLELPRQGEQRNRRKRLLGRIRSDQGRPDRAVGADRPHRTARAPSTRAKAAGSRTP